MVENTLVFDGNGIDISDTAVVLQSSSGTGTTTVRMPLIIPVGIGRITLRTNILNIQKPSVDVNEPTKENTIRLNKTNCLDITARTINVYTDLFEISAKNMELPMMVTYPNLAEIHFIETTHINVSFLHIGDNVELCRLAYDAIARFKETGQKIESLDFGNAELSSPEKLQALIDILQDQKDQPVKRLVLINNNLNDHFVIFSKKGTEGKDGILPPSTLEDKPGEGAASNIMSLF